jgi:hypothetical protein
MRKRWQVRCRIRPVAHYLIPDFIPVIGYLDDVVIVPLGILAVVKMIPPDVMADSRAAAALAAERPVSATAAVVIVLIWTASIVLTGWLIYLYSVT